MNLRLKLTHNNRKDITFLYKPTYYVRLVKEANDNDYSFIPRFTLKDYEPFLNFPINTPTKPSIDIFKLCLKYGLIISIDYKGSEDERQAGHTRTIYPMAIGLSKDKKPLLRGYQLVGWSVSENNVVKKEWRLFRIDRILNITFLGAFYRLPPEGYNTRGDKSMTTLIKNANFNEIRKNQEDLIKKKEIDLKDRVVINKLNKVFTKPLNKTIKLNDPYNGVLNRNEANKIRVTLAKPVITSMAPAVIIIGTNIIEDNTFKLYADNNLIGSYKSIKSIMANELADLPDVVDGYNEFRAYLFIESR